MLVRDLAPRPPPTTRPQSLARSNHAKSDRRTNPRVLRMRAHHGCCSDETNYDSGTPNDYGAGKLYHTRDNFGTYFGTSGRDILSHIFQISEITLASQFGCYSKSDKDLGFSIRARGFSRSHGQREQPAKASSPEDTLNTYRRFPQVVLPCSFSKLYPGRGGG